MVVHGLVILELIYVWKHVCMLLFFKNSTLMKYIEIVQFDLWLLQLMNHCDEEGVIQRC